MKLVKKLKINISSESKNYLLFASEKCRLVYNFALADKMKAYKDNKENISIYDLKKEFNNKIKPKYPEYKRVYNKCLSAMFFRLDNAYKHFFGKYSKFPKFKRKGVFVSQEYPGMYIKKIDDNTLRIPTPRGIKYIMAKTREIIPNEYHTVTIQKNKDNYFACFIIDVKEKEFEDNGKMMAIDLGIKTLVTGYNGVDFYKVRKYSHYTRHLDELRSKRDKCKKNSRRRLKWNKVLNRELTSYRNRIKDYLHKKSYELTKREEGTIVVGKLNLEGMKKPKQAWFNKILFNEWRVKMFVDFIRYKSKLYGKRFMEIDESGTTKECSRCSHIIDMTLKDRVYKCPVCGLDIDRDENSAINIYNRAWPMLWSRDREFATASNLNMDICVHV